MDPDNSLDFFNTNTRVSVHPIACRGPVRLRALNVGVRNDRNRFEARRQGRALAKPPCWFAVRDAATFSMSTSQIVKKPRFRSRQPTYQSQREGNTR